MIKKKGLQMIILVDGYNLLKKIHGPLVTDVQRSAFVNLLGAYLKRRSHKLHVVFDGGPCINPLREKQKGVSVWYSGEHQSADDLIISYVHEHKNKEFLVVTLDREIRQKVGQCRAETMDPTLFYEKVYEICHPPSLVRAGSSQTICKLSDEEDHDLDELMHEAAAMKTPFKDENSSGTRIVGSSERSSKKDKAYKKVIDKL
jgi:predicted RNA-binding protein with PIN domain